MSENQIAKAITQNFTSPNVKDHLEAAWGIDLNELPKSTVCRVRKALNIETTGGVNPTRSRPTEVR